MDIEAYATKVTTNIIRKVAMFGIALMSVLDISSNLELRLKYFNNFQ